MPNWLNFGGEKKPEEKKDGVVEITPEQIQKQITDGDAALRTELNALGTKIDEHPTLKAMQVFLDSQQAATERQQQQRQAAQQNEENKQFENMDETTRAYIDRSLNPLAQQALWQNGTEMRRTIFEDQEAFPFYTGSIKAEVDALLDKQPASMRANADVIRNTYKIVVFDKQKEISENKHKSRFASASQVGSGTGMKGTDDVNAMPELTSQMKLVAARMGLSEADYAKSVKELQEVGQY